MNDQGCYTITKGIQNKLMLGIFKRIAEYNKLNSLDLLIEGETGVGKTYIARKIHETSSRRDMPFVRVDTSMGSGNIAFSVLFGHIAGSFTDAVRDQKGLFYEANGGTLFLDDIQNMDMEVQKKILEVIEEREITPLGSCKPIKLDIRIIAASNLDLSEEVKKGNFRQY